jgi:hypothetical protein
VPTRTGPRTAPTPMEEEEPLEGVRNREQHYGGGGADAWVARPLAAQAGRTDRRRNIAGQGVQSSVRRLG